MITTVTLNAAIDVTYMVPSFHLNQVNRVSEMWKEPGGKGINAAKILKQLDVPVMAAGFAGGYNGQQICRELEKRQIPHRFVSIAQESRLCLNLVDPVASMQTEILEPGPSVCEAEWAELMKQLDELSDQSAYMIFSGSLPQGIPLDAYAQLIERVQAKGVKAVLDTSGEALSRALPAKPFLIKPNREEFSKLMGHAEDSEGEVFLTEENLIKGMKNIHMQGVPVIVVSLGGEGSFVCDHGRFYRIRSPEVQAVNEVGCGDAFTAALTAGLYLDKDMQESLVLATAVAAACAMEIRAGVVRMNEVVNLEKKVRVL